MFKNFAKSLILSSIILSAFSILFSCSVGLGESVDTEVPKVEITYPPASSAVRDWFCLAGNCSDDKGVDSISVSAKNISTNESFPLGSATPAKDGTWQIKINEKDSSGSYKLKDGTYTFSVVAIDSSKQQSAANIRTLEIDNTPPVFVIKNPGTTNSDAPASFGSILKIVGAAADEHEIYELELKVYSSADMSGEPKATLIEKSVDKTDGINVTLARYNLDVAQGLATADELHNNYLKVYDVEGGGDQQLFASVILRDSAGVWQNPLHTAAESIGNSTSGGLYLNDDIYNELMGKNSKYGLTAADFMKIINGTYKTSASANSENSTLENNRAIETDSSKITDEAIKNILAILNQKKTETSATPLSFKLNKDANPTYEVMGFAFNDSEAETFASHKAAKKSSLTFKAQAGLDGTYIEPKTFKVYMFGPYDSCSVEQLKEIRTEPESYYNSAVEKAKEQLKAAGNANPSEELVEATANARILADYSKNSSSSTETFTETIELPSTITKGSFYVLAASGKDIDGLSLLTQNNYGFIGESAGTPPTIVINGFADGAMTNVLGNVKVSGTLKSEETELAGVTYSIVVSDETKAKNVATITGEANLTFKDSKKLSADWNIADFSEGNKNYEDGYSSFAPEDGERYKYSVTVSGKDRTGLESKDTRSFTVDRKVPEIKINDITPVAKKETAADGTVSKYIVNGKIKFSTVVTDTNLKNVKVTVTDGTKSETLFEGNSSTIEKEIDTTKYKDENFLTFKVEAEDSAENMPEEPSEADVWISQKTDKPEIKFTNGKSAEELGGSEWTNVTNGQNVFGIENNNSANFTITDDDGLSLVRVTVFDENKKQIGSEGAVSVADAQLQAQPDSENAKDSAANPVEYKVSGGSTSYALSYKLPQKAGKYKILIEVFDTGHDDADEANKVWHTTKCENYVLVSEGRISISFAEISNNTCHVKANEKTTIKGTVSLSALEKLASIERFASTKTTVTEENGTTDTKWIKVSDCSSKYPYEENTVETEKITAKAEGGKIVWEDNIPASMIVDGTQHFFYKATDIAGNSAEIELICNGDGTVPEIKNDSEVYEKYKGWVNSTSVKLSVIAADVNGYRPSGIAKVLYSYKKGDSDIPGELSRDGKPCDADGKINEKDGKYYKYSTTIDLSETPEAGTMITFTAEDKVGNKNPIGPLAYKVDTTAPSAGKPSIEPSQVLNSSDPVVVTYSASDALSGVKSVEFSTDSNMKDAKSVAEKTGTYAYPLAGLQDGERTVYVRVTDNAGNRSESVSSGSFIVDNTPPKVTVTSPASGNVVNKTISLSGTVVDNNLTKTTTPVLRYFDATGWKTLAFTSSTLDGQNWTISGIDTTKLNNSTDFKEFEFKVQFTDDAGNVNESLSSAYKLKVDQNTDRSEIKLTNVKISGSITSSSEIMGVITDDDGNYNNLKLYRINKADYDSNTSANKTPLTSGSSWKEITVENGTGIWKTKLDENESQGLKSWYFYVTDSVNGSFCTAESSPLNRPYLSDSSTESGVDNTTGISFTFDNKAPEVSLKISHDGTNWEDTNSIFGINSSVYIKAIVKEEVGMKSATLSVGGKEIQSITENPVPAENVYEYSFSEIELTMYGDIASLAISVTAEDSAGQTNKDMRNITVDSKAPSVKIVSPTTSSSDIVSSAISIKGTVLDDYSSIETLKYAIPFKDNLKDPDWKNVGTSAGWEIRFASGAQESSESLIYYAVAKDANGYLYDIKQTGIADVYEVPIWFYVKDSAGNEAYIKDQYVLVDSESGKPKAWINSPADGTTTSGVVTVYGGAIDNVTVDNVCVQIDANNDGKFDLEDKNYINDYWNDEKDGLKPKLSKSTSDTNETWYILANGTNSWKLDINSENIKKIKKPGETAESQTLRIRVKAIDNDTLSRDWSDPIEITIDGEKPVIKNIKLVQYGKNVVPTDLSSPITEREYISGMYISNVSVEQSGNWYLTAEVLDNEKVDSIKFTRNDSLYENNIYFEDESEIKPDTKDYKLRVPLKTDETGVISYRITATDNGGASFDSTVTIKIDNTPPSLYDINNKETVSPGENLRLKSMLKILGKEPENSTVVNNNKYFTFGDYVQEGGSGLAYIAFYFERQGKNGENRRIYNPMFGKIKDSNKTDGSNKTDFSSRPANPSNGNVYINSDGLAAMYVTVSSRDSVDSISLSAVNPNVRKGGLIKIGGSYSLITDVTESGTKVKFSPSAATTFTEAEIIFAQVVDHKITESVDDLGNLLNDDGDKMIESIEQLGSSYTWSASVDSTNIPDGPINIHVVAIDNAGNISKGSIATKVENNRPRIAKVLLGTDLNEDGYYDWNASEAPVTTGDSEKDTKNGKAFGEFSYFSALNPVSRKSQSEVTLDSSSFKVISGLCIIPEFVGGNKELGYILENPSNLAAATYTSGTVSAMTSKNDIISKVKDKDSYGIEKQISDFGGVEITKAKVTSGNISITFWDKTEETEQGKDSQWALLKIPVKLMSEEDEKPVPTITPFYWKNSTENSVYIDKGIKGHIELEDDWKNASGYVSSDTTGEYDSDPKVSGKIKIEGTVTDNVRLGSISMKFDGLFVEQTIATYEKGSWTNLKLPNGVESVEVKDVYISQQGHEAKYTLVVDTEKLEGVAGIDKNITISATDWTKKNTSTSDEGTAQTTENAKTARYRVDVVPYVTGVETDLSEFYRSAPSVYARTARGKYPVNENETITLKGYNLGTSRKVKLGECELNGSDLDYNIGKDAKSGNLEVTVAGIKALNNLNSDSAEYNKQPNGVNNDILNDNLEFDVWQFKAAATAKNGPILQPHMKVGPSGELGFSYANATLYFNMPGKASNSVTYGQTPFGRNFGGFTQNTFTYDSNGNAYGVALCPDTSGEAGMSANLQFFSRTSGLHGGEGGGDLNNNYYNQNYARRIENTSIKLDGSSISQHINRILSPSMATYTDGETTYVYVAYYDELARQVRFRVGSVGTSANDIGMGLVDLAGATGRKSGSNDEPKLNKNTTRDSISGYRTEAGSIETIDVSSVTKDIYVRVASRYGYNHIHAWDGYSTAYPGVEMSQVAGYYVFKMPDTSSTKLLFNNGSNSNQTADLSISSSGVYEWNDSSLEKMTSGTISYQPPASSMPTYAGYQYCHVVAASGVSGGTAEYASATKKRAGQYVAVGSLSDGTAVMAWYDSGYGRLALSYNESPRTAQTTLADGIATWQKNSYYVSNENIRAGTYVSMAVDNKNGIHLAYYSATGGDLYYSYISDPKTKTVTKTVIVDSYGSVGTYPMIDVAKDSKDGNFIPYISFRCESNSDTTASVKIAYPVNWDEDGNVLNGVDSDDRYTGDWEVSGVPTDNTPLTDYTNIGMNKDPSGVKKVFATGNDFSQAWAATFAVSDSTTVYGNGTSNPVVSYAVSENGVLEMAQKK